MSATTSDTDDVVGQARGDLTRPGDSLVQRLTATSDSVGPTVARLALGLVMMPHAVQKISGFGATYGAFTQKMHLPGPIAFLAIAFEVLGSFALVLGCFTRLAALAIITVMLGAIYTVHAPNGFFMNWQGHQAGEGFEYHLLAIGLGVVLVILGGGRASIDRLLMNRRPMVGGSVPNTFTGE